MANDEEYYGVDERHLDPSDPEYQFNNPQESRPSFDLLDSSIPLFARKLVFATIFVCISAIILMKFILDV